MKDSSVYEVRTYYHESRATWDQHDHTDLVKSKYGQWCNEFFAAIAQVTDVPCVLWRISGSENTAQAGPGYEKGTHPTAYEAKYPDAVQCVTWTLRWDSEAHAKKVWGKLFARAAIGDLLGRHPMLSGFNRMESRFMTAIVTPQRFFSSKKVYEVRNYTLDTDVAPWNEENRSAIERFATALLAQDGFKAAVKVVSFNIAQAPASTTTTSAAQITGKGEHDDTGVVPPQVQWVAEWDSKEHAEETWGAMFSDQKHVDDLCKACGESPWWKVGKPLFGYKMMDSTWMVNANLALQEDTPPRALSPDSRG